MSLFAIMVEQCTKESWIAPPPKDRKQDAILITLRRLGRTDWMTTQEIAYAVGIGICSTKKYLAALREEGLIQFSKPRSSSAPYKWRIPA